ncbi:hypothetical protein BS17DRAFT_821031 [Gyrodon lividus]|nr:hypothetical protein BS17DRAFT_821031 [Gyrodon lividus]
MRSTATKAPPMALNQPTQETYLARGSPVINRQTKWRHKLKSPEHEEDILPPPASKPLDPVLEFNYRGAGEFLSALSIEGSGHEGISTSDINKSEVEQGSGEEININISSMDNDLSSDDMDRNIAQYMEQDHPRAQAKNVPRAPVKQPKSSMRMIGQESHDLLKCCKS